MPAMLRVSVLIRFLLVLTLGLALSACGGGGGGGGGATTSTPPVAPTALSYSSPVTAVAGQAITALNPAITGSATAYSVSPALPAGLAINPASGQISGTPTTATAQATYTITAGNVSGSTTFGLSLRVNPAAPTGLSYPSPQIYFNGKAITALNPTVTGTVTSYVVSPALPAGLTLNGTSGQISGTPTAIAPQASYVVTASNVTGSTTFSLSLTINVPPKFTLGAYTLRPVAGAVPANASFLGLNQIFDIDGNGWGDLIWTGAYYPFNGASPTPQQGYVAFNGLSGFAAAAPSKFPYSALLDIHAREFAFVDFNADGVRDVFVADHGYDAFPFPGYQNRLFLSQSGTPNWVDATANLPQQSDFTHSVCTGDVNNDGKVDIFAGNGGLTQAYFLRGDGTGHFVKDSQLLPINSGQALENAGVGLTSCSLVDLDGNTFPELILGTGYSSRSTQVLWNFGGSYAADTVGAGTISALPGPTNFGTAWSIYEIQATDLNGDNAQDLVVVYQGDVNYGGWQIQFLVNQGNYQFVDQTTTYLPDAAAASSGVASSTNVTSWIAFLIPQDLNGDTRLDYWVEANPWGTATNDNMPLALIRQPDGSFVPVKVGELRAAGVPSFFFNGTVGYEARGTLLPGELAQAFADSSANNQVKINALEITFR
ncbi:MAG: putative Ig domain-containing protein [Steroidobacteraceae bacterium]